MEENLLTYLARRWETGKSSSRRSKDQFELREPLHLGTVLLVMSGRANREITEKALLLSRLIARKGGAGTVFSLARSKQNGGYGFSRLILELIRGVKQHDQVHLLIANYLDLFIAAPITVILSRFLGKPVMLETVGSGPGRINRISLYLVAPWLSLTRQLLVPVGRKQDWSAIGISQIEETTPLIDLDQRSRGSVKRLQPSVLADGRNCDLARLSELIEGYRLIKHKYPRIEMRILIDRRNSELHSAQPGLSVTAVDDSSSTAQWLKGVDLFIACQGELSLRPVLLEAAAEGKIILTGRNSLLTAYLKERCNFEPITVADRSDMADKIITLIEEPQKSALNSRLARGLAERFAWDNLADQWAVRYARQIQ